MINQDNVADDTTWLDKLELSEQTIKEDYVSHIFPFDNDLFAHRATATKVYKTRAERGPVDKKSASKDLTENS